MIQEKVRIVTPPPLYSMPSRDAVAWCIWRPKVLITEVSLA